jgi:ATP-dependent DNA helicase DinG
VPLPDQFQEFRPHQIVAVQEILDHFADGKRVVFLDAPTGSGKTLIGEMTRRLMGARQCLYVCNNKSLQDQFVNDFDYASLLKGRANYPTLDNPTLFPDVSAADCNREQKTDGSIQCDECWAVERCNYLVARGAAEMAALSVLNTAYLLTATNKARMFAHRDLVICDEADELESELMRHVEVVVSRGTRNWLNIDLPENVTDMAAWAVWLEEVAHAVSNKAHQMSRRDRKDRKRRQSLEEVVSRIRAIIPRLGEEWVVDGYEDARYRRGTVERETVRFRPVQVRDIAEEYLWQHGNRWLCMSATIISGAQMAADLGLEDGTWAEVRVPSTFAPERRPVFLDRHVGPVTRKTEAESRPLLVDAIAKIGNDWPDERILVHTHSYDLTRYVSGELLGLTPHPIVTYDNSRSREGVLDRWLATPNGILLAPSFDRGVDLFDDRCRIQVIAKAPFPYLGDKQVSKRMHGPGGQVWYVVETIRSIVQATGRVMRSEDDWGATYVLDGSVWRMLSEHGGLFPSWWREAVVKGLDSQSREIREGFEEASR